MKTSSCLLAISLAFSAALSGCTSTSTISSTPLKKDDKIVETGDGVLYALPKRMARLTIEGKPASTKIDEDLAKAKKALDAARAAQSVAKKKKKGLEQELKALQDGGAPQRIIQDKAAEITLATAELAKATVSISKAQEKYSSLLAQAQDPNSGKVTMSVKLELLPAIPDPNYWYIADVRPSIRRDDKWELGTTDSGLLSNGSSTSTDKIADILVDIAGLVGIVSMPGGGYSLNLLGQDPAIPIEERDPCNLGRAFKWEYDFDPIAADSGVNEALIRCALPFQIRVDPAGKMFGYTASDSQVRSSQLSLQSIEQELAVIQESVAVKLESAIVTDPEMAAAPEEPPEGNNSEINDEYLLQDLLKRVQDQRHAINISSAAITQIDYSLDDSIKRSTLEGLVYRRQIPYNISIHARFPDNSTAVIRSTAVLLPQGGPIANIPYKARPFVSSVTNTTFVNGQPTKWHSEKPSEVAAAFRIPVSMAKALVSIPAELIRLRVDYTSDQSELIKAQAAYVCALEALQKAEGKDSTDFCAEPLVGAGSPDSE